MAIILVSAPMLNVEASVKGADKKLQIDLSNGVIQNGYFSLPIDKSSDELIFDLLYTAGYIDETNNDFIAMATRVLDSNEWFKEQKLNIPLDQKIIKFNNVNVFSYRDEKHLNYYDVPFQLNGKEISVTFLFSGGRGSVDFVCDREGKEITLKSGDVLIPIFPRNKDGKAVEDLIQKDKKIIYNNKLFATEAPADTAKLVFTIFAKSTYAEGHCESAIIVPAKYKTINTNNTQPSNTASSPSTWAKADIEKAKQNDLTTERVMKDYQKPISREEFCELAVNLYEKLSGNTAVPVSPNPFKDTSNIAVLKANKLGIVNGTGNGEFSPNKPLNREQMATMFFSTIKLLDPSIGELTEELSFSDKNTISQWALQPVKYMNKENIIVGSNNLFNPQQEASKEQAIVLVNRVFEKLVK
jgi:hypothetical protein